MAIALGRQVRRHGEGGVKVRNPDGRAQRRIPLHFRNFDDRYLVGQQQRPRLGALDKALQDQTSRPPTQDRADRRFLGICREFALHQNHGIARTLAFVRHALNLLGDARVDERGHDRPDDTAASAKAGGEAVRDEAGLLDRG